MKKMNPQFASSLQTEELNTTSYLEEHRNRQYKIAGSSSQELGYDKSQLLQRQDQEVSQ